MLLTDLQMHSTTRNCLRSVLLGAGLVGLQYTLMPGQAIGAYTGLTLVALGIFAFALKRWQSDPGLWMLATLILSVYAPVYFHFQLQAILTLLQFAPQKARWDLFSLAAAIDGGLALIVFGWLVRFLVTTVARNWRFSRNLGSLSD